MTNADLEILAAPLPEGPLLPEILPKEVLAKSPVTADTLWKSDFAALGLPIAPEEKTKQIEALRYIEILASQTATPIGEWDLEETFALATSPLRFVTDRTEVNRRFFERRIKAIEERPKRAAAELSEEVVKHLSVLDQRLTDKAKKEHQARATQYLNEAMRFYSEYENHLVESKKSYQIAEALQREPKSTEREVRKVIESGFWELTEAKDLLKFVTASDIYLTYKNPAAAIDLHVNFGRFEFRLRPETGELTAYPFQKNRFVDNCFHPHLVPKTMAFSQVCWGSAKDAAPKLLQTGEYGKAFEILANLLTNYNAGNPFRDLTAFSKTPVREPTPAFMDLVLFEPNDVVELTSRSCSEISIKEWPIGTKLRVLGVKNLDLGAGVYMIYVDLTGSLDRTAPANLGNAYYCRADNFRLRQRHTLRPIRKLSQVAPTEAKMMTDLSFSAADHPQFLS